MFQKARDRRSRSTPSRRPSSGHGRARGRQLRVDHLRGVRPGGVALLRRRADRQPQPHRIRRARTCSPRTAAPSPSPARWRGSSSARASMHGRQVGRRGRPHAGGARRRRRGHRREGDFWRVTTGPTDLHAVRTALSRRPAYKVEVRPHHGRPEPGDGGRSRARPRRSSVIDALDDLDDVQDGHGNFDIPDEVLAELD
jgi:hypothetical protein